jgi:phosphoribosylglycinamide formyltransferase-1
MTQPLALAVLVSGEGTTLEALAEAIAGGHLPARIELVVADRPHAPAIERARRRGLPTAVLPFRGTSPSDWSDRLTALLRERGAELVLLAGFLAILPPEFLRAWTGRTLNVHPALLPRYGGSGMYGRHVHEAVLRSGDAETGVTVHLATEEVDAGPVLWQERTAVEPGDTPEVLRERLRPLELKALSEVLRRFADGTWSLPYTPVGTPDRPRSEGSAPG